MSRSSGEPSKPQVMVLFGTRPEAVKLAPVVEALRHREHLLEPRVVHTGQHEDLVEPFLDFFRLRPHHALGIMRPGQDAYDVLARGLAALRDVLEQENPSLVLVQGDTATVLLGALASFLRKTPVGHVEAGLRSGDRWAPFPEEVFRRMTSAAADHHFAPTARARANLVGEGVDPGTVHVTGNPVVDALLAAETRDREAGGGLPRDPAAREALAGAAPLALMTAHRREAFGAPLERVFETVGALAREEGLRVLFPVHPNPQVREPARRILGGVEGVHLVEPLTYLDLVRVLRVSDVVLTDSGGLQEEAPTFRVPVLVLRETTERPEGLEAGTARLVGTDAAAIAGAVRQVLREVDRPRRLRRETPAGVPGGEGHPYGDGMAGERIAAWAAHIVAGEPPPSDWKGP